jgi:hypothetical protein
MLDIRILFLVRRTSFGRYIIICAHVHNFLGGTQSFHDTRTIFSRIQKFAGHALNFWEWQNCFWTFAQFLGCARNILDIPTILWAVAEIFLAAQIYLWGSDNFQEKSTIFQYSPQYCSSHKKIVPWSLKVYVPTRKLCACPKIWTDLPENFVYIQ